jgi:hypothetical protein
VAPIKGSGRPSAAVLHYRGRVAALERCVKTGERPPNDPELIEARRNLAAVNLEERIARAIAAAPPLTDDQRNRISALLRTGGDAA